MLPDAAGLETFTCLWILIKRVKLLIKKRALKAWFFSRKQLESEGLAELQYVIDSTCCISQSNDFEQF